MSGETGSVVFADGWRYEWTIQPARIGWRFSVDTRSGDGWLTLVGPGLSGWRLTARRARSAVGRKLTAHRVDAKETRCG